MNIQQMRYVLEVEKTGSISQAAENLYMGQPNLSKAIKELELYMGIRIFKRTSKGVTATSNGAHFLKDIRSIVEQIDDVEARYCSNRGEARSMSVSVPHCWRFSSAFAAFVKELDEKQDIELDFSETDSLQAINNVMEEKHHIGIIRYHIGCEPYFLQMLSEQDLQYKLIWDFESFVLMSCNHPLAAKETISISELDPYIEVSHGGCTIFNHPDGAKCKVCKTVASRKIRIHARGSLLDMLSCNPHSYMWSVSMPPIMLERNALVQKKCKSAYNRCRDVLIFPNGYTINELESLFLKKLNIEIDLINEL